MNLYKLYMEKVDSKLGVFQVIFITIVVLKFFLLETPFYYEEKPDTILNISNISLLNIIIGNYEIGSFAHHPPLLPLYASVWKYIFGFNPFVIHLGMAFITSIGLTALYFLYKSILENKITLWLPCLLIFFTPTFFIHSTNYRFDIFTAAIGILYIYFRKKQYLYSYIIFGVLLAYSRETTIAFLISVLVYEFLVKSDTKFKFINMLHILCWCVFFIMNKYFHETFTTSVAKNQLNTELLSYLKILWFDLKFIFIDEFRFILSALGLFSVILKRKFSKIRLLLLLPIIFYCLGMSFHIFEASYYLFPVYPMYYLLISLYISDLLSSKKIIVLSVIWIILGIYQNEKNKEEVLAENSTYYKEIALNFKDTINYLNEHQKNKTINLEWPLVYYSQSDTYGYFESEEPRFKVISLTESNHIWAEKLGHGTNQKIDCDALEFTLIGISQHGNPLQARGQKEIVTKCGFFKIESIQNNMAKVDIYERK